MDLNQSPACSDKLHESREVFLDVWRQAGRFEGRSAVSTWLLSIARFKALSVLRRSIAARRASRRRGSRRPLPPRRRFRPEAIPLNTRSPSFASARRTPSPTATVFWSR